MTKTAHLFQTPLEVCRVRLQANWIFYLGPFSACIHLIRYFTFQALVFWRHPLFQGFACWKASVMNSFRKKNLSLHGGNLLWSFPPYPTEHLLLYSVQLLMHWVRFYKHICINSKPGIAFYIALLFKKEKTTLFLSQVFSNYLCKVRSLKTKGCKSFVLANIWLEAGTGNFFLLYLVQKHKHH